MVKIGSIYSVRYCTKFSIMRIFLLLLFSSLLLFNHIDGKKGHWPSTTTTTNLPDLSAKRIKLLNDSSEVSLVKDDSIDSDLVEAVGQAANQEIGVVKKSLNSKQSLQLASPKITESTEEDAEVAEEKPTTKNASLFKVHLDMPSNSRAFSSELVIDSAEEEDIRPNKTTSKQAGEKEKVQDSETAMPLPAIYSKQKGDKYEMKEEVVDPYQNLRRYTFRKQADDEEVEEKRQPVAHALPHSNVYILRPKREDPAKPKPVDPALKDVKEAPGGLAFNVGFDSDKASKPKPVLSSSSRSSSTSSRSSSPRIEAGLEVRKKRALENSTLSHSVTTDSNRSMLTDLLGIGLNSPPLADHFKEDNAPPKKLFNSFLPPPSQRPRVHLPSQSASSSSSSENTDKSQEKDSSGEKNSLEQMLVISKSREKVPKQQSFINNMHKNSMKTGPIFIKNSELHFESSGMARMHKTHPFDRRALWNEDPFHGPMSPIEGHFHSFEGPVQLFLPKRGPPPFFAGHPSGLGGETEKDDHFPRDMPLTQLGKEIERGEEGLWMAGSGLTLALHLNACSLGILSMLVVIVILFKLYKMLHKKQTKHFYTHGHHNKGGNEHKQTPSISACLDEIKI